MLPGVTEEDAGARWAQEQRALARALGVSLEAWLDALDRAGRSGPGLTAAVIGAAMARGLGMGVLADLNGPALAKRARLLVDPAPPRAKNPIIREAIRRAGELPEGGGMERLRRRREAVSAPRRGEGSAGVSATTATPDAPGEDDA